eukprot:Phypoly_transcript_12050.p1 GENE.Phypoly_transcript_12050~~Phypoly_transcript_12050.p1  ORF type:complete len:302 (+),score=30.95 Phypoly_transcript_12050:232-1137(+)
MSRFVSFFFVCKVILLFKTKYRKWMDPTHITKEFMGESRTTTHSLPFSGLADTFFGYPLDTAKARTITSVAPTSLFGVFGHRSYGFPGVEVALANAAFQRYLVKPVMYTPFTELAKSSPFLAGACAGCVQAVFSTPFEVLKTYIQVNPLKISLSTWRAIQILINTRGFSIFFSGLEASMVQLALQGGIYYALLFPVRRAIATRFFNIENKYLTNREKLITNITAGIAVGLLSTLIVHPIDVARTLIQGFANDEAPWLISILLKLFREKGIGIFSGYGYTALQVSIVSPFIAIIAHILKHPQ